MKSYKKIVAAGLLAVAGFMPATAQQNTDQAPGAIEQCFILGVKTRVRCLTLDVPLDYGNPEGEKISVFAAVIPASGSNVEPDPLWVFAGGPGQAAAEYGMLRNRAFKQVGRKRDIVLVDQRGTGKSHPLQCESDPSDVMEELSDWTDLVAECRKGIDVDVRQFTMENVISDMEAVRQALGYDQLNLWGGSWGTRTVGLYLKRHPEHVRSIIVDGVAPPDVSLFETAPTSADRALRLLINDCMASEACKKAYPDIASDVATFLDQAAAGQLVYNDVDPVTGKPLSFTLSFVAAVESIRATMYNAEGTVFVPMLIHKAAQGDLKPILAALSGSGSSAESMYIGATLSILCGEEMPRTRADHLAAAAADSFAKDSYYQYWKAGCAAWDALPQAADAHDPVSSEVPTLILSGDLDPVTPPSMGAHWLKTFPNGRHIVVNGNGHITSNTACMPRLLGEFVDTLDAQSLDTSCLGYLKRLPVITGLNGTVQ